MTSPRLIAPVLFLVLFVSSNAVSAAPALERVILNQGGVAYYELSAAPTDGAIELDVPRDQMDDVLKSLTVLGKGARIDAVTVAGEAPTEAAFGSLPFGPEAFDSLPGLLRALRGEVVTLTADRAISGRILSVDPVGGDKDDPAVTIRSGGGMIRVPIAGVRSVSLADKAVDKAMDQALDAFEAGRRGGVKHLRIDLGGDVDNKVTLAYVAGAPLWKSVYRLTLDGAKGDLEGWAVLENFSGRDWTDVNLALSSGNPANFRQALYRAHYVDRPEVPVELFEQIVPPVDAGVMAEVARPSIAPDMMVSQGKAARAPAQVQESTTEILIDLGKVSLANGKTLAQPITQGDAPVEAVTYLPMYDERPLAAFRIENKGKTSLPPGVVTVYQLSGDGTRYLGDSRMGVVPVGEDRLLSYAGDFKIKVDRRRTSSSAVGRATIADGVMSVVEIVYHNESVDVALPKSEARTMVVDFGAADNWKLVAPKDSTRKISNGFRVTRSFGKGEKGRVEARFADERIRRLVLVETGTPALMDYVTNGNFEGDMKDALDRVIALKRDVATAERTLGQANDDLARARDAEARARENLKAVGDVPLRQQYLEKLVKAEAVVDAATGRTTDAEAQLRNAEAALRDFVRNLNVKS